MLEEEVVVPFRVPRDQVPMGTEFRSTWLSASLEIIKERGWYDRYLANLSPADREIIVHSVAGLWLPSRICVAHYRAADALGVSTAEQVQCGREVTKRLQKTIFSIGFRAAREAGVTPLAVLKQIPVTWDREWKGGGVGIFKVGPKDARVEVIGYEGAGIAYCRNGLRGVIMGMCELVCTKAYATEVKGLCTNTNLGFRVAWA